MEHLKASAALVLAFGLFLAICAFAALFAYMRPVRWSERRFW
ncbi:hypothetical protein [Candidatus Nitrospira bockiana]